MPRATVIVMVDRPGDWELAEAWVERRPNQARQQTEASSGCSCNHAVQTSLGMIPVGKR